MEEREIDPRIEMLQRRWEMDPNSRVFLQLAEAYRKSQRHDRAIQVLEEGIERHQSSLSARVALGRCYLEAEEPRRAVEILEEILGEDPTQLVAYRLVVQGYVALGDGPSARSKLNAYQQLNPLDPEIDLLARQLESLPTDFTSSSDEAPSTDAEHAPEQPVEASEAPEEPESSFEPEGARTPQADAAASVPVSGIEDAVESDAADGPRRDTERLGSDQAVGSTNDLFALPPVGAPAAGSDALFDLSPETSSDAGLWGLFGDPADDATDGEARSAIGDLPAALEVAEATVDTDDSSELHDDFEDEVERALEFSETDGQREPQAAIKVEIPDTDIPPPATTTLADLYLEQGHLEEAKEIIERVLADEPDNLRAQEMLRQIDGTSIARLTAATLLQEGESLRLDATAPQRKAYVLRRFLQRLRPGAEV